VSLHTERVVSAFKNRKVLVTGGLGFIGSNLVLRLVRAGARVAIVDAEVAGCGANRHNIATAEGDLRVISADVGDSAALAGEICGCAAIFNLAGEISHIQSMRNPRRDAALNAMSQLRFVEECARQEPGIRVVYASTRQIYGIPQYLPVDEAHPIQPVDFNGVHKYAATQYHLLWSDLGRIDARVLCLTNIYGPRLALGLSGQGFLGNFLRRGLLEQPIDIFGDGRQLRDPVYVDDAVDAFLLAGMADAPASRIWNVGGFQALPLAEIASVISTAAGAPPPVFRPFPNEHKGIDIGSYCSDSTRIREELGWQPTVSFSEGVRRTLDYFRRELPYYLPSSSGEDPAADLGVSDGKVECTQSEPRP
jgi:UDP-glucose 4-epimerase